tara:strand:- start:545 stop:2002 length:1458 start_codon:yes stop_codon:yes gene_type:complete
MSQTKAQLIDAVDGSIVTSDLADDAVNADKLASNSVVSASIVDGSILNADINASAAIAGSKIDPSFTSSITVTNTEPKISLVDTNANDDFEIKVNAGNFAINDATNSTNRFLIDSSGTVDITGNLDVGAGIDVTGAITSTGNLTITNENPIINFTDSNNNSDFRIQVEAGSFLIEDTTNAGADRLVIDSNGTVSVNGNLDVGAGIDVTGAFTTTGSISLDNSSELGVFEDDTSRGFTNSAKISLDFASNIARIRSSGNGTFTQRPLAFFIANEEELRIETNGTLNVNNNAIATNNGGDSNIDHFWHNDSHNCWIFNSDTTLKATTGTSRLRCAGIDFGDSNADADILDEYEEGSWTPTLKFGGSSSGITYESNLRGGNYTRVGRMVTLNFAFQLTDKGSQTGHAEIHGIPFTAGNHLVGTTVENNGMCSFWDNVDPNLFAIMFHTTSSTHIEIKCIDGAEDKPPDMTNSIFLDDTSIRGSLTYFT